MPDSKLKNGGLRGSSLVEPRRGVHTATDRRQVTTHHLRLFN